MSDETTTDVATSGAVRALAGLYYAAGRPDGVDPCDASKLARYFALADALDALRAAVEDAGPEPAYHRKIMERHRGEWPALWRAIDALLPPETP